VIRLLLCLGIEGGCGGSLVGPFAKRGDAFNLAAREGSLAVLGELLQLQGCRAVPYGLLFPVLGGAVERGSPASAPCLAFLSASGGLAYRRRGGTA
jgi:hypothetical protein